MPIVSSPSAALRLLVPLGASLLATWAAAAEPVPELATVRSHIEQKIATCQAAHHAPTLGLLHDVVVEAITYGAPSYNNGDRAGCVAFYVDTAKALDAAFPAGTPARPLASEGLADLRAARQRDAAIDANDSERRAWTMRLAFDQITVAWISATQHGEQLVKLGNEYFHRGDYAESELVYSQAEERLGEVRGDGLDASTEGLRMSPLLHAQAELELGHFTVAASAVASHLEAVRDLLAIDIDMRRLYGNGLDFERSLLDLERSADSQPQDADLRFFLGYECWFSGNREQARAHFAKALAISPTHAASGLFAPGLSASAP